MSDQFWRARIVVTLKPVVNDPQGLSIRGALHQLGYPGVESVRAGKHFDLRLQADSREQAEQQVEAMCRRLLANPVIERYRYTLARAPAGGRPAARAAR